MRIVVHDYVGHPGQATLSRGLAARGHTVWNQFSSSYIPGRGAIARRQSDPPGPGFEDVPMRGTFRRYSPIRRLVQETWHAFVLGKAIRERDADVVVFSNVPLIAHVVASQYLRTTQVAQVFWQHDIYSDAIGQSACNRFGPAIGGLVGKIARALEKRVALTANAVVCISATFQIDV